MDQIDHTVCPVEVMKKEFPGKKVEEYRRMLGQFGVTGNTTGDWSVKGVYIVMMQGTWRCSRWTACQEDRRAESPSRFSVVTTPTSLYLVRRKDDEKFDSKMYCHQTSRRITWTSRRSRRWAWVWPTTRAASSSSATTRS